MDDATREALARELSALKLKDAQRKIRDLDRQANMVFWRNSIWDEYHTVFLLPNVGVQVILVEQATATPSKRRIGGGPEGSTAQKFEYRYVEARVTPLERPAFKRAFEPERAEA
jgi:hypothetical protein